MKKNKFRNRLFCFLLCSILIIEPLSSLIHLHAEETESGETIIELENQVENQIENQVSTQSENETEQSVSLLSDPMTQVEYNTVYLNLNGGSYNNTNDLYELKINKENSSFFIDNITPIKEGYSFVGWYNTLDFSGTKLSGDVSVTSDLQLYANWIKQHKITYHLNGATYQTLSDDFISFVNDGTTIDLLEKETLTYENKRFYGWYDNASLIGTPITNEFVPTSDIDLYAKWDIQTYITVTFHPNDNSGLESYDAENTPCGETQNFPAVYKTGYKLVGWYKNASFDEPFATGVDKTNYGTTSFIVPETNVEFFAKWEVDTSADVSIINFLPIGVPSNSTIQWLTFGNKPLLYVDRNYNYFSLLKSPLADGHDFVGWFADESCVTPIMANNAIGDTTKTIYAKFKESSSTISITIPSGIKILENGILKDKNSYTINVTNGNVVSLPTPYKENYLFTGWKCIENEKIYQDEYIANEINTTKTFEPQFVIGTSVAYITCISDRSVHYADVTNSNSRCPYCGHTTYEILYAAINTTVESDHLMCANQSAGLRHKFETINGNSACINKEYFGPSAGASSCSPITFKELVTAVFPDQSITFEFACTGGYTHEFSVINGVSKCAVCGILESDYVAAFNAQNPSSPTAVDSYEYLGLVPTRGGADTIMTSTERGYDSVVTGDYSSYCVYCPFRHVGTWYPTCSICGSRASSMVYDSWWRGSGYYQKDCPNCGRIWTGVTFTTHSCISYRLKVFTATFNANNAYPQNSRGETPSTSNGTNVSYTCSWRTNYTSPSIATWQGYTSDRWMNTSYMTKNGTQYIMPNTVYSQIAEDANTINLYSRHIPYKYTVKFNFNRPASSSSSIKVGENLLPNIVTSTSAFVNFDDYLTSAINSSDNKMDGKYLATPTMEGWIFKGWSATQNGTNSLLTSSTRLNVSNMNAIFGSVKPNGSTLDLYAIWEPIKTTYVFHANNDKKDNEFGVSTISGTMPNLTDNYDDSAAFPNIGYTRSFNSYYGQPKNYVFMGWLLENVGATNLTNDSTTTKLAPIPKDTKPMTNKVRYLNISKGTITSFNSLMLGATNLSQSTYGQYVKNKCALRYGALSNESKTYANVLDVSNSRWDYAFVATKAKSTTNAIRFNYATKTPYVTFYNQDDNYFRNIPDGSFILYNKNSSYDSSATTITTTNGIIFADLYAAWGTYNSRPQAFFTLATKQFNQDGTFTGYLKNYEDDSFFGNKKSGNLLPTDTTNTATTVYDDAYVYLHAGYYDPETKPKSKEEYQFSVDGGTTWYLLQPGIKNSYFDCVTTTMENEGITTTDVSTATGFTSSEISGSKSSNIYKILFKTKSNGAQQQVLLRYRAKDSVTYNYFYNNVDDYENNKISELQKELWSTGYYYDETIDVYETVSFEGQALLKYKGDIETAGTLTYVDGTIANNSNENGSWATKTITIKSGNAIPVVGLNGSNKQSTWYKNNFTSIPMYDYYTNAKTNNENWKYTKGNIYLLISKAEENYVKNGNFSGATLNEKIINARGLTGYSNIVLIKESEMGGGINTGSLSYNSGILDTDNSGSLGFTNGSQYTTYIPGDESVSFIDTTTDKDKQTNSLYFIAIVDKDSKTDVLRNSTDIVASQNETTTGTANIAGGEIYANNKTISNGMVYTYKNETFKTADSSVGVTGHIFTSHAAMVKFIYDRVKGVFPEVSDLYNGQYSIFYATCDTTWNKMSPPKWSTLNVQIFETQPRLSITDVYVESIKDSINNIENPITLWKDNTNSPKYKVNGYTNLFNPVAGVNAYRGNVLTIGSLNRYIELNNRNDQSIMNYTALSTELGKSPVSYNVLNGYETTVAFETIGADYAEVSLLTKTTKTPISFLLNKNGSFKYDNYYSSDLSKQEQYTLTYLNRKKETSKFSFALAQQTPKGLNYGINLEISKKLITQPGVVLKRTVQIGENSILAGSPSLFVSSGSILNDTGVQVTN